MRSLPSCLFLFLFIFCTYQNSYAQKGKYTDYDRGYYHFYYGKWDSGYFYFNRYLSNPDDTLNKGKAFLYMGETQWNTGDFYGAQENLLNAIKTLEPTDTAHREFIGFAYTLLGNVSLELKQYQEAIGLYNQATGFLQGHDYITDVLNGKATAYQKNKNYVEALNLYDSIYKLKPGNQLLVARVIDNRAMTRWHQDHSYPALPELWEALRIRTDSQYNMALNASYAHLADYYALNNPDSARWYAAKMLEKARSVQSTPDILEAMDKLILLNNDPALKQKWYSAFRKISDSLQLSRDTTRTRFALIRYDVQKSKADNLVLQQHISRQQLWMFGLIAAAIAVIAGLSFWYTKRRQRIKLESENAIRNARLKTSQKVHDVVANGLYGIMNELEHSSAIDREPLINKIEILYEKSRDISYEDIHQQPSDLHNVKSSNLHPDSYRDKFSNEYHTQIHELLTAFANEHTKVIVVGNQPSFWEKISSRQKHELRLVLQEIMVNMKKHSRAKNVSVTFKKDTHQAFIDYKDDGRGIEPGKDFGNGLTNTVNRINSLNGAIIFGQRGNGGVSIELSLPLESSTI